MSLLSYRLASERVTAAHLALSAPASVSFCASFAHVADACPSGKALSSVDVALESPLTFFYYFSVTRLVFDFEVPIYLLHVAEMSACTGLTLAAALSISFRCLLSTALCDGPSGDSGYLTMISRRILGLYVSQMSFLVYYCGRLESTYSTSCALGLWDLSMVPAAHRHTLSARLSSVIKANMLVDEVVMSPPGK